MSTTYISCTVGASDPTAELGFEVWMDSEQIFDSQHLVDTNLKLSWPLDDQVEAQHVIKFVLKNKTQAHTTIDDQGNIVKDATVFIKDLAFDDIQLNQIFFDHAIYSHNRNGSSPSTIEEKFYGIMGCNGTVSLTFTAPSYLWLLKNM